MAMMHWNVLICIREEPISIYGVKVCGEDLCVCEASEVRNFSNCCCRETSYRCQSPDMHQCSVGSERTHSLM